MFVQINFLITVFSLLFTFHFYKHRAVVSFSSVTPLRFFCQFCVSKKSQKMLVRHNYADKNTILCTSPPGTRKSRIYPGQSLVGKVGSIYSDNYQTLNTPLPSLSSLLPPSNSNLPNPSKTFLKNKNFRFSRSAFRNQIHMLSQHFKTTPDLITFYSPPPPNKHLS